MIQPSTGLILKTAARDGLREWLRLPLWWYGAGLALTLGTLRRSVRTSVSFFSVDVWAKNVFVPMYGDDSLGGRTISFFVRASVLGFRSLGVVVWIVVAAALAALYLALLPVAVVGFATHLIGVLF